MRNLASIQKIVSVNAIEGADRIEVARVLGWDVIVKKGDFKPDDLCVYIEIDSILPDRPEFAFLLRYSAECSSCKTRWQTNSLSGEKVNCPGCDAVNTVEELSDSKK